MFPPPCGTTSHDLTRRLASAAPLSGKRGFLSRGFVTRALRLAPGSRVSNVQNGTHWTVPFVAKPELLRDAVAKHYRTLAARVGAEKWLSNGAYALSTCSRYRTYLVLRNPRNGVWKSGGCLLLLGPVYNGCSKPLTFCFKLNNFRP